MDFPPWLVSAASTTKLAQQSSLCQVENLLVETEQAIQKRSVANKATYVIPALQSPLEVVVDQGSYGASISGIVTGMLGGKRCVFGEPSPKIP